MEMLYFMLNVDNLGGAYKSELFNETDDAAVSLFINSVLSDMESLVTSRQLTSLHTILLETIHNYSVSIDAEVYKDIDYKELNQDLLTRFLEAKKLQGLSERTLEQYEFSINYVLDWIKKGVDSITIEDIRNFMDYKLMNDNASYCTLDNYRRFLNSFYNYCVTQGLLYRNPVLKMESVKQKRKIKQPFSNEEIIYLRENLHHLRNKAIFELLLSSGMRVGELTRLNYKDLNMNECSCIVHGKGNKEREVYFNDLAKISIQRYLESRDDANPALFVTLHKPHTRLTVTGVEVMLRNLGKRAGVNKVHPHRFRRHMATTLLNKGVQIEQIQQLLGHAEIETTKLYIVTDDDEIRYNHKRYVN